MDSSVEDLQMLIDSGANIDAVVDGIPILESVLYSQSTEKLKYLLNLGADTEIRDKFGNTPLAFAAINSYGPCIEQVSLLLEAGADIDAQDNVGNTALMSAMFHNRASSTEELLKKGASIEIRNNKGWTPFLCASSVQVYEESLDKMKMLIEYGADWRVTGALGETALMLAAQCREMEKFNYLLKLGADPKKRDSNGSTLLMYAAQNSWSPEVVYYLLDSGADINAQNNQGWTALMLAANHNSQAAGDAWVQPITPEFIVQSLIDNKADVHILNQEGIEASRYAFDNPKLEGKWTMSNLLKISGWGP